MIALTTLAPRSITPLPGVLIARPQWRVAPLTKIIRQAGYGVARRKVAIFAGLHGDAEAGIVATQRLAELLARPMDQLQEVELHLYPKCNPSGWRLGTALTRDGEDLLREFWIGSEAPEIAYLEKELREEAFDVIITLDTDEAAPALYGEYRGGPQARALLEDALSVVPPLSTEENPSQAETPMPHVKAAPSARGALTAPPDQRKEALLLHVAVPGSAALSAQVDAMLSILWKLVSALEGGK